MEENLLSREEALEIRVATLESQVAILTQRINELDHGRDLIASDSSNSAQVLQHLVEQNSLKDASLHQVQNNASNMNNQISSIANFISTHLIPQGSSKANANSLKSLSSTVNSGIQDQFAKSFNNQLGRLVTTLTNKQNNNNLASDSLVARRYEGFKKYENAYGEGEEDDFDNSFEDTDDDDGSSLHTEDFEEDEDEEEKEDEGEDEEGEGEDEEDEEAEGELTKESKAKTSTKTRKSRFLNLTPEIPEDDEDEEDFEAEMGDD
jgi:hypothetical protein